MSAGWEIGDRALCVEAYGINPAAPGHPRPLKGGVYTVEEVNFDFLGTMGVVLIGHHSNSITRAWVASCFRKIKPDAHEACEAEFVTLINRAKRPVPVMHTDGSAK